MKKNQNKPTKSTESAEKRPNWFQPTTAAQGKLQFGFLPIQLLLDKNVSKTGLQAYCALAVHANPHTGLCGYYERGRMRTPSLSRLAAIVGVSERTIRYGIENLVEAGWIKRRIQRFDNTLILWLGLPDGLDLADGEGNFKGVPEAWGATPDDKKSEEELTLERLERAPRNADGSADIDILDDVPVEPRPSRAAKASPVKTPAKGTTVPVEPSPALDDDAIALDDPEAPESLPALGEDAIPLKEALRDYLWYRDMLCKTYGDAEISRHGFTYSTPWPEVYARFSAEIDSITA